MMEDLKNILPVDNINPDAAVTTLSKRESGSLIVLFVIVILLLLGFIVYLAMNSNPQCAAEKADLRKDIAIRDARIVQLESSRDLISEENKQLKDSITKYEFINQFNQSEGAKQIILSPKRRVQ